MNKSLSYFEYDIVNLGHTAKEYMDLLDLRESMVFLEWFSNVETTVLEIFHDFNKIVLSSTLLKSYFQSSIVRRDLRCSH